MQRHTRHPAAQHMLGSLYSTLKIPIPKNYFIFTFASAQDTTERASSQQTFLPPPGSKGNSPATHVQEDYSQHVTQDDYSYQPSFFSPQASTGQDLLPCTLTLLQFDSQEIFLPIVIYAPVRAKLGKITFLVPASTVFTSLFQAHYMPSTQFLQGAVFLKRTNETTGTEFLKTITLQQTTINK